MSKLHSQIKIIILKRVHASVAIGLKSIFKVITRLVQIKSKLLGLKPIGRPFFLELIFLFRWSLLRGLLLTGFLGESWFWDLPLRNEILDIGLMHVYFFLVDYQTPADIERLYRLWVGLASEVGIFTHYARPSVWLLFIDIGKLHWWLTPIFVFATFGTPNGGSNNLIQLLFLFFSLRLALFILNLLRLVNLVNDIPELVAYFPLTGVSIGLDLLESLLNEVNIHVLSTFPIWDQSLSQKYYMDVALLPAVGTFKGVTVVIGL